MFPLSNKIFYISFFLVLFFYRLSFIFSDTNFSDINNISNQSINSNIIFNPSKLNINQSDLNKLKNYLEYLNVSNDAINKILNYLKIHGEFYSFDELFSLQLSENDIKIIQDNFFLESKRKSIDEIIKLISYNSEEYQENLEYFYDLLITPLDLTKANQKYIALLPGFNEEKAKKIVEYREKYPILELFQLTNTGLSIDELLLISPFITLSEYSDNGFKIQMKLNYNYKYYFFISNSIFIEDQNLFNESDKLFLLNKNIKIYFSPGKLTNLFLLSSGKEIFINSIYNFSLDFDNIDFILGYYKIENGQNLLLGNTFLSFVNDINSPPIIYKEKGLKPYYGSSIDYDDNKIPDLFYGCALKYENYLLFNDFYFNPSLTIFYSYYHPNFYHSFTNKIDYGLNFSTTVPINNSYIGFNIVYQEYTNKNIKNYGGSFYYRINILPQISSILEVSKFDGFSFVHNLYFDFKYLETLLLFYYNDTNYNYLNRGYVIRKNRNQYGLFYGLSYTQNNFKNYLFMDLYSYITNFEIRQKYEYILKYNYKFDNEIINEILANINFRLYFDENIYFRTKLFFNSEFLKILNINFSYQNYWNIKDQVLNNLYSIGIKFIMFEWLILHFNISPYFIKNFINSIYTMDFPLYPGDNQIIPHYGNGIQYTFILRFIVNENLKIYGKYIYEDFMKNENCYYYRNYLSIYSEIIL